MNATFAPPSLPLSTSLPASPTLSLSLLINLFCLIVCPSIPSNTALTSSLPTCLYSLCLDQNLSKFIGPGGVFALVDSTQLLQVNFAPLYP